MNLHLDRALETAAQIDAILHAVDVAYMEDAESRLQHLHYILQDLTAKLVNELELLAEDGKVVDAIYAVNDAKRICTLKTSE